MTKTTEVSGATVALDLVAEIKAHGPDTYTRDGVRLLDGADETRALECIALVVAKLTGLRVVDALLEDGTLIVEVA